MNTTDLTTIDPSTNVIALGIVLFVAFCCAVIFVGMALDAGLLPDEPGELDITYHTENNDEDNVIFRS